MYMLVWNGLQAFIVSSLWVFKTIEIQVSGVTLIRVPVRNINLCICHSSYQFELFYEEGFCLLGSDTI